MMVGAENKYSPIEKMCLALIFPVKKLRHYLLAHQTMLISKADPIKYIMTRSALLGNLAKWAILLMEFYILYVPQKAIKGQALADFLAAHPVPDDSPLNTDLPDEEVFTVEAGFKKWEMYFDGASRTEQMEGQTPKTRSGAGVVFVTPQKGVIHFSFALLKGCSNNEAELSTKRSLPASW